MLEAFVSTQRDKTAALTFLCKLMKQHGRPVEPVTDRCRSCGAALKEIGAEERQVPGRWEINRIENSYLPFQR